MRARRLQILATNSERRQATASSPAPPCSTATTLKVKNHRRRAPCRQRAGTRPNFPTTIGNEGPTTLVKLSTALRPLRKRKKSLTSPPTRQTLPNGSKIEHPGLRIVADRRNPSGIRTSGFSQSRPWSKANPNPFERRYFTRLQK